MLEVVMYLFERYIEREGELGVDEEKVEEDVREGGLDGEDM